MADNDSDLPEGTDKVIAGASGSGSPAGAIGTGTGQGGTSTAGATGQSSTLADTGMLADTRPPATGIGNPDTGSGGTLRDRFRSSTQQFSGQAGDKARGLVGQGLERSAEALGNVGRMIGDTATGLDERLGQEYGDYARRAAEAIESTASSLASKDPDELLDDTRNFVRKSPGVALAGAAVVGFVVARLIKSGLGSGDDEDRTSGDRTGRGGGSEA